MIINKFKPTNYIKTELDIQRLNSITNKEWMYAANGRSALYHCLKSLNINDSILLPVYICESVLTPIKKIGLKTYFYDLNDYDLNASIEDIEKKIRDHHPNAVIVASMYGTPADLSRIESLCQRYNIFMIDDAAQSFGAKANEQKYVGTFGDAGFFSFSPGKPTSGHLGAFFWTKNRNYKIRRTHSFLFHYLKYIDFYFNRYKIDAYNRLKLFKLLKYPIFLVNKFTDITNNDMSKFENKILGGILQANFNQTFRRNFFKEHKIILETSPFFRLVTKGEASTNNHKLVLLFNHRKELEIFKENLKMKGIFSNYGYSLLSGEGDTPVAQSVYDKILEIPIEENSTKMRYLIKCLTEVKI